MEPLVVPVTYMLENPFDWQVIWDIQGVWPEQDLSWTWDLPRSMDESLLQRKDSASH